MNSKAGYGCSFLKESPEYEYVQWNFEKDLGQQDNSDEVTNFRGMTFALRNWGLAYDGLSDTDINLWDSGGLPPFSREHSWLQPGHSSRKDSTALPPMCLMHACH